MTKKLNKDENIRAKEMVNAKLNNRNSANILGFNMPFWLILIIVLILLYI